MIRSLTRLENPTNAASTRGPFIGRAQRPLLPNMSEARMRSSFPSPSPALRDPVWSREKATGLHVGPSAQAASACSRRPRGPTFRGSDTFTLHDVEQHAQRIESCERCASWIGPVAISCWMRTRLKGSAQAGRVSFGPSRLLLIPDHSNLITGTGGARRDRTDDLMLAKHALSQLSYCPGQ